MTEKYRTAAEITDANDEERKADYFARIRLGKTSEYKSLVKSVEITFSTPEQRQRAISFLRSGKASTANEARMLMQREDMDDKNTHR